MQTKAKNNIKGIAFKKGLECLLMKCIAVIYGRAFLFFGKNF
jgi:hypothetical protein